MDVTWRFLKNVQHTYDAKRNWSRNMTCRQPVRAAAGGEYPLQGRLRLE